MRGINNNIDHIMKIVAISAALLTMAPVWAGGAAAVVVGPLGDPPVVQTPAGTVVNPIGVPPTIVKPPVASQTIVNPPFFNPFFKPAFFNPFFRPAFFNPFFGADVDVFGVGAGIGAVD